MLQHFESDTLCVGACFDNSHRFQAGINELDGLSSPWNTLTVWNIARLAKTGFLLVSEGVLKEAAGGIEEVSVIALHQQLFGVNSTKAKLLKLPACVLVNNSNSQTAVSKDPEEILWDQAWKDPLRASWHVEKMKSKLQRASNQLDCLQLNCCDANNAQIKNNNNNK